MNCDKQLNAHDFLRLHLCEGLQSGGFVHEGSWTALTAAQRVKQVIDAKRVRNFFFTSTILGQETIAVDDPIGQATLTETPRFGVPTIVTDMLSMVEFPLTNSDGNTTEYLSAKVEQYGGDSASGYGRDLFELYSTILTRLLMKHEKNRVAVAYPPSPGPLPELCDKWISFVPRLIRPFESWRATFIESLFNGPTRRATTYMIPHIGLRGLRVLRDGDPYAQVTPNNQKLIDRYVGSGANPETFFIELRTTLASLGAAGAEVTLRTPKFERPLLILGAASNVDGCQAELYDENDYYTFTYQEAPKITTAPQDYTYPPLQLIAPNTDYRNTNLFNMWPVPHVLETGDVLRLRLRNGCLPSAVANNYSQVASTRNDEDVRVTFVCRTV